MTKHEIAASIARDEKYFRKRGLPTLIEDYTATEDILTRAWPWLAVLFVMQVTRSLVTSWTPGLASAILAASVASIALVWALVNRRLGRPLFALPARLGWWSAAIFVVIPSLMRISADNGVVLALRHIGFNIAVCALVVGIIGWGLAQTLVWALVHVVTEFGYQLLIVFRQMATIFLFCFLMFFNQELWQFANVSDDERFGFLQWVLITFALLVLMVGTPRLTKHLERDLLADDERLTWGQRINFTFLFAIRQFLQLFLILLASLTVFTIVSAFVVGEQLLSTWQLQSRVIDSFTLNGQTYILTDVSMRVSSLLALVATLNFAVVSLTSKEGRENFLEGIEEEVGSIFERRRCYRARRAELCALAAQDAPGRQAQGASGRAEGGEANVGEVAASGRDGGEDGGAGLAASSNDDGGARLAASDKADSDD